MKNRFLLLLLILATTTGFAQSSGGGFTTFTKVKLSTNPTNNPFRGKLLVRDTITGNIDKMEFSALPLNFTLTTAGISGISTLSAGNLNIPRYDLYSIPRLGTETSYPIDGDFESTNSTKIYVRKTGTKEAGISINNTGVYFKDDVVGYRSEFFIDRDVVFLNSNLAGFKGILGSTFFENKTNNAFAQLADIGTGWASYGDTVYTVGSPFVVNSGVTATLGNNGATVMNSQLPYGVTSWYNGTTNKFTPTSDGDYYLWTIRFKAKNTASLNAYFDIGIDVGGSLGVIFKETKLFVKGAGVEQDFTIVIPGFSGSTFVPNGGIPKVTSYGGNSSFYDITYQIERLHKKR